MHDASFAVVRYETGITSGAFTLYDAAILANDRTTRAAYVLGSLFQDGRVTMQAGLEGARRTAALAAAPAFAPLFTSLRGEVLFDATTTIQTGYMPTAQFTGRSRVRFERTDQGGYAEAAVSRAFDGRFWQTVVQAEAFAWVRRGDVEGSVTATPMQLGVGDLLMDAEARITWARGRLLLGSSLGLRAGEADRGVSMWGGITATIPVMENLSMTANIGRYPADLVQNLPAGRYVAVGFRLPHWGFPPYRLPPLPPPPPPRMPDLPVTERLALVIGPALDSTNIREIRIWAPGARVVEIMADFVNWIPVPVIRQPNGEWRGYYRVAPGLYRLNIRIDGTDLDVPMNWPREQDEFLGMVALVRVR